MIRMKSTSTKFERVYHPWTEWEEVRFNMWGDVGDRAEATQRAVVFTGDAALYGGYMMRVVNEWPVSCENALTDYSINRRAWVGHAAVALALGIPEDITRLAWGKLSGEQQLLANKEASKAISAWEHNCIKSGKLHSNLAEAMLF